jgi:hypothetical protein
MVAERLRKRARDTEVQRMKIDITEQFATALIEKGYDPIIVFSLVAEWLQGVQRALDQANDLDAAEYIEYLAHHIKATGLLSATQRKREL